ncbi:hypothetical protein GN109_06400 [Collimonas pratensis]|uniref:hypothetical protein n=1 Tax=Collimonas pratensis TaxID=279113 RepID=UPI00143D891B|nr:hypothetical protein [Collimonas pratensis]NKI69045.1 hypothetical protein [Collimonas pratensis]
MDYSKETSRTVKLAWSKVRHASRFIDKNPAPGLLLDVQSGSQAAGKMLVGPLYQAPEWIVFFGPSSLWSCAEDLAFWGAGWAWLLSVRALAWAPAFWEVAAAGFSAAGACAIATPDAVSKAIMENSCLAFISISKN